MSKICEDLRAAILQAAMQGKLTERLSEDDSAEELRERIIKERSVFKANKFIEKSDDDIAIPDMWCSLKSGEVFELLTGEKITRGEDLPLFDAKYFRGKQISKTNKGNLADEGDILILVDGENSGETFLCVESGYMGSTLKKLFTPNCMDKNFVLYFLEMNRKILRDNKRGAAIPHLDKKIFFNFIFPIPSLAEQKRIVEKVDELMARVTDLEQSTNALESLKKAFPDDIKAALLQAAMQGKLTEQLPEDGNAESLLEQIRNEKEKLITEGKIKKQKALAPITDDEIPFSISENWKWVRLNDISLNMSAGKDKPKDFQKERDDRHQYPVVANGVTNDGILGYTGQPTAKKNTLTVAGRGTIGFSVFREYEYCPIVRLIVLELSSNVDPYYIQLVMQAFPEESLGTSIPQLTVPMLRPKIIPLPPLAEQRHIAKRLDTLFEIVGLIQEEL